MIKILSSVFAGTAALMASHALAQEAPGAEWARTYFQEGGSGMPACGLCHILSDAETSGEVGPNLDELQPDETMVRAAVSDGVGVMPSFKQALDDAQIDAMAVYVARAVR